MHRGHDGLSETRLTRRRPRPPPHRHAVHGRPGGARRRVTAERRLLRGLRSGRRAAGSGAAADDGPRRPRTGRVPAHRRNLRGRLPRRVLGPCRERRRGRLALPAAERLPPRPERQPHRGAPTAPTGAGHRPLRQRVRLLPRTGGPPYALRAIPPQSLDGQPAAGCNYHDYRVLRPFSVDAGPIAPWFDQPGLGWQYQLDSALVPGSPARLNVLWLVQNGYLERLV
ncbi:TNT domain-containing protein [Streptacidiphilus monticola]